MTAAGVATKPQRRKRVDAIGLLTLIGRCGRGDHGVRVFTTSALDRSNLIQRRRHADGAADTIAESITTS